MGGSAAGPRRFALAAAVALLAMILTAVFAASPSRAATIYDCEIEAHLGGAHDKAVVVEAECEELLIDLIISSQAGPVIPHPYAWNEDGERLKVCHRNPVYGWFSARCGMVTSLNSEPTRISMAARITGDRCSDKIVLDLAADERCEEVCAGVGTVQKMKMPRPRGC